MPHVSVICIIISIITITTIIIIKCVCVGDADTMLLLLLSLCVRWRLCYNTEVCARFSSMAMRAAQWGRYKIRNGTERRNGTNKTISCIRKVIKFVEYIRFQLRRLPKQFINMHNVHLAE